MHAASPEISRCLLIAAGTCFEKSAEALFKPEQWQILKVSHEETLAHGKACWYHLPSSMFPQKA